MDNTRKFCYKCHRPESSCMCKYIQKIDTKTKFVILMHPKEFKKTKNITGHFTHLSLSNSKLFVGVDFSDHKEINSMIEDPNNNCYVLYPKEDSIILNDTPIKEDSKKQNIIFIIDGTWYCAKTMLRLSQNLSKLPKMSFTHTISSAFKIKEQPKKECLSTMESTLCILRILDSQGTENISKGSLEGFLTPFYKMVEYQYDTIKQKAPSVLESYKS